MTTSKPSQTLQPPRYVVGPDGRPTAVVIDLPTWKIIVERLEAEEDNDILREAAADLAALASGALPSGWKTLDEFEAELDALEEAGELPG